MLVAVVGDGEGGGLLQAVADDGTPARRAGQAALFEHDRLGLPDGEELLAAVQEVHADQRRRLGRADHPGRLGLLAAAESARALAAAEMAEAGRAWRPQ